MYGEECACDQVYGVRRIGDQADGDAGGQVHGEVYADSWSMVGSVFGYQVKNGDSL